jgi:hypothetical protein
MSQCPSLCIHPTPGDNDFNKLAFVLCLKTFMQIWALWAHWFSRRSFKYVPFISKCKNNFPYCGPIWPPGAIILTNFLLYNVRELLYKIQLFLVQWFLRRRFFILIFFLGKHMLEQFPLLWPHPTPGGHDFKNLFCTMSESLHVNFSFSGQVVL